MGVTAGEFLCPNLVSLFNSLKLSKNIAGVFLLTFVAIGNAAPDIFSSIAGIQHAKPDLVIGALFGGGIFVITIIVGGILLMASDFTIMQRPIIRDIIFYGASCLLIWGLVYHGSLYLWHVILILSVYVVYIIVVIVGRIIYKRQKAKRTRLEKAIYGPAAIEPEPPLSISILMHRTSYRLSRKFSSKRISTIIEECRQLDIDGQVTYGAIGDETVGHNDRVELLDGDPRDKMTIYLDSLTSLKDFLYRLSPFGWEEFKEMSIVSRVLAIIKAPFKVMVSLVTPVVDTENHRNNWCRLLNCLHCISGPIWLTYVAGGFDSKVGLLSLPALIAIIELPIAIVVWWTSEFSNPPKYHFLFSILGFIVAGSWTYLLAIEIIDLLTAVGILMTWSEVILGLTVLAWVENAGDLVSSIAMTRQGFPQMGISACFGGPLLNLLMGVGIPYAIMLPKLPEKVITIEYSRMFTLLIATSITTLIVTLITFIAAGFRSFKLHGLCLIAIYITYLTIAIFMEVKVF